MQEAKDNLRQSTEQLGSTRQQLEDDDRKRASAQELPQQLAEQKKKLDAWGEVNQAIGSRSGDRFRIFAQEHDSRTSRPPRRIATWRCLTLAIAWRRAAKTIWRFM
jgi:DNA repair exonuclease SbcCD ATPase subunit